MYSYRTDRPDDFLAIVREVGQWLTDTGQTLWEVDTLTADNLLDKHTRGNCYVMYRQLPDEETVPVATFILQWASPIYFGNVPENTAGFIHKLAIRRAFAGQNLFGHILDFCRDKCLERGIHELQLETDATRPALMRYYERYDFQPTYQQTNHEFGQTFRCQYYRLPF